MVKAKRVKGSRDAPTLPPLSEEDFKPVLWAGAKKASWTIKEAACYVNEKAPDAPIDINGTDEISRIYVWLNKEVERGRLSPILKISNDAFSPGTIMRHLWEAEKHVSLRMWALYTYADEGEVSYLLKNGISTDNYITAAKLIEDAYPKVTRAQITDFLMTLPDKIKGENEIPVFFIKSEASLTKLLMRNLKKRKPGRQKKDQVVDLYKYEDSLIETIRKELGHY
jgi:hypothetical protein